jgi:hypothetical protein
VQSKRINQVPGIQIHSSGGSRAEASDRAHASAVVAKEEDNSASGRGGKDWVQGDYGPAITGPRL